MLSVKSLWLARFNLKRNKVALDIELHPDLAGKVPIGRLKLITEQLSISQVLKCVYECHKHKASLVCITFHCINF